MNLEMLGPNLSFTIENEMGNLHKIRLFSAHMVELLVLAKALNKIWTIVVLLKQKTYEMKTIQMQVYIQQW